MLSITACPKEAVFEMLMSRPLVKLLKKSEVAVAQVVEIDNKLPDLVVEGEQAVDKRPPHEICKGPEDLDDAVRRAAELGDCSYRLDEGVVQDRARLPDRRVRLLELALQVAELRLKRVEEFARRDLAGDDQLPQFRNGDVETVGDGHKHRARAFQHGVEFFSPDDAGTEGLR